MNDLVDPLHCASATGKPLPQLQDFVRANDLPSVQGPCYVGSGSMERAAAMQLAKRHPLTLPVQPRRTDSIDRLEMPSRMSAVLFAAKVIVHRARRGLDNLASGPRRLDQTEPAGFPVVLGESRSRLWSDSRHAEWRYQLGKVQNLRRALRSLHGVLAQPGETFSFWKQIGRPSRGRGYVTGRMLQQGCLVPAIGGGLCQLSNALYDAALKSGCEIVERHAHSRVVPGSAAAIGRDATVAWNYVDLRFRARQPLVIEAQLTRDELVVRFRARTTATRCAHAHPTAPRAPAAPASPPPAPAAASCATCDATACFRHEHRASGQQPGDGRTAFLLDVTSAEFRDYVRRNHRPTDVIGVPLDGRRWRLARYRWDTGSFARVASAPLATLAQVIAARRLKHEGPARRAAEFSAAARLAAHLSHLLTAEITEACVAQSLLPFLWREGHLGGRRFRVLLTRLPMHLLQARLDAAAAAHPDRASLADFRAPAWVVEAEREALAQAESIITPHAELAQLFGGRTLLLDWAVPPVQRTNPVSTNARSIAFPGPTIARKGAYEVRAAARALDLEVVLLGSDLEGPDFWRGVRTRRPLGETGPGGWLDSVAAIVQPALFEERPRHLLTGLAAGVPTIATTGCGIPSRDGLTIIPHGDPDALVAALRRTLDLPRAHAIARSSGATTD